MRLPYAAPVARTVAVALLSVTAPVAQERPLPDQDRFLKEARTRLQTDSSLQSSYIYVETRREQKLDGSGRVKQESVKVYESYPGLPGEDRWERLISENGRSRPAADLEKELRDRQKKAEALVREAKEQPAEQQARQQREYAERRREFDAVVDDVFRVYSVRMERRELVNGHETIVFSLTPRPDAKPRTRQGNHLRAFAVHAWISESDKELVRVDAEAIDTLSLGFGVLARLHKGAKLSFLRTKVNNEVWLPSRVSYMGNARVGLIAVFRRSGTSEYSNYRKFSVDTSTTYQPPRP
jgi:multidrug efflux pump subunit AcrA (membrane-fusion protein)